MKALRARVGIAFSTGLLLIFSLAHGQSLANANETALAPIEYSTLQHISSDDSSAVIAEKAAKVLPRPNQMEWMRRQDGDPGLQAPRRVAAMVTEFISTVILGQRAPGFEGWIGCEYVPAAGTSDGLGWLKKCASA